MTILNFYEKPVILDRQHHRQLRLKKTLSNGFAYAASTIAIPVAIVEFPHAALEYPIVFAVGENGPGTPVVVTGIREKENLFVDETGAWLGTYIPAFVRRYPFVLNIDPESATPMVLVDEAYDGFSTTEGDRLFEENGQETELTKSMLAFLGDFKAQGEFSNEFMMRLKKYDLLIPQALSVDRGDGAQKLSMDGFHIVDEKRLHALDDAAILELARSGDLGRIHAHLLSLNNIQKVLRLLNDKFPAAAAA